MESNIPQHQQNPYHSEFSQLQQVPNNFMPLSIISTILGCCSPCFIGFILGIIAIVFSSQVSTKFIAGDYQGAQSSAKTAKILAIIALTLVVLNIIISTLFYVINGASYYQEYIERIRYN